MTQEFNVIKNNFLKRQGQRDLLREQLEILQEEEVRLKKRYEDATKARVLIQTAAKKTQQNLEYHIGHLVSLALGFVFPNPPKFVIEFVTRRNKTECDLFFEENGNRYEPLESRGGGICDVASFALRVAVWALRKNSPLMILDEPFRNVSPDLQESVSIMLEEISENLSLQILMVSHAVDINTCADKVFFTSKIGRISSIVEEM